MGLNTWTQTLSKKKKCIFKYASDINNEFSSAKKQISSHSGRRVARLNDWC